MIGDIKNIKDFLTIASAEISEAGKLVEGSMGANVGNTILDAKYTVVAAITAINAEISKHSKVPVDEDDWDASEEWEESWVSSEDHLDPWEEDEWDSSEEEFDPWEEAGWNSSNC